MDFTLSDRSLELVKRVRAFMDERAIVTGRRIAAGRDEVHLRTVAKLELKKYAPLRQSPGEPDASSKFS